MQNIECVIICNDLGFNRLSSQLPRQVAEKILSIKQFFNKMPFPFLKWDFFQIIC